MLESPRAMYGVYEYCSMVEDRKRVEAYRNALAQTVTPSSVVVDLGTGIGLFAILAAQLGARHVYGIEQSDLVELGPELAKAAGVGDRVTFMRGSGWELEPKERANVLFYDMRGNTPLFCDNYALVRHAKARWLAPGGIQIPARDNLRVAVVTASALFRERQNKLDAVRDMGLPTAAIERIIANTAISDRQEPILGEEILTDGATWATMHYGEPPPRSISGRVKLSVTRAGVAHGLGCWFQAELVPGVTYENGPGHISPYANQLLPFESAIALSIGDSIEVEIDALTDGSQWGWSYVIRRASGETVAEKRQSTLFAQVGSVADLLREAPVAKPVLNDAGRKVLDVLRAFDGDATLAGLAKRFATDASEDAERRAFTDVRDLARRYSR